MNREMNCSVSERFQQLAFVIADLNLYLDTHPYDEEALAAYRDYYKQYVQAVADYQEAYGPLTVHHANPTKEWTWAVTPWPWQKGCE